MKKVKFEVRKNTYYDSVTLMLITKEVEKIEGVHKALVGMGTDLNKELAENLAISNDEIKSLKADDFFVTVEADEDLEIDNVMAKIDELLSERREEAGSDYMPPTLRSALNHQSGSNMVLISIPGEYAAEEARNALNNDLNVLLFSDNVSLKDERELKELACEKGLLMMGPDCGTAIINNVPLAFANVIEKGNIGVVGASGTGIQEVTTLIDSLGEGISQAIGTGGRDLHDEIGGLMMLQGIEALKNDPDTKVLVLISKPPSEKIAEKVIEAVKDTDKPVIVNFLGGDRELVEKHGLHGAISLEDTARKAVALLRGQDVEDFQGFDKSMDEINEIVEKEVGKLGPKQKYLRGLYTGGTLADEAMQILSKDLGNIYSNIPLNPDYRLEDVMVSQDHTCIDFGEDEFTVGRPHPMIDPSTRAGRLAEEGQDEEVALVLMDFVIGYGAHEDPIGEMLDSLASAKKSMEDKGGYLPVIASICGSENDPQDLAECKERLEEAGVVVMPSNAQAVRLAGMILDKIK